MSKRSQKSPVPAPRAAAPRARAAPRVQDHAQQAAKNCVLLTNDDGIDSKLTLDLAKALGKEFGCRIVLVAPADNKSAASMALSLKSEMQLHRRPEAGADAFSLSGTPADCVLAALDPAQGLLAALDLKPMLVISGPNYGPNLSSDVLHSGTVGAARVAAMLGVPAIASSAFMLDRSASDAGVISATISVVQAALDLLEFRPAANWPRDFVTQHHSGNSDARRHVVGQATYAPHEHIGDGLPEEALREAFAAGEVLLNINVPQHWDLSLRPMTTTGLGLMYYYNQFETNWHQSPGPGPSTSPTAPSDLPPPHEDPRHITTAFHTQPDDSSNADPSTLPSSAAPPPSTLPSPHDDPRQVTSTFHTQPDDIPDTSNSTNGLPSTVPPPPTDHTLPSPSASLVAVYHNKFSTRGFVHVEGSDLWALEKGIVSITPLQTWPEGHPMCLKDALMSAALRESPSGMPEWLSVPVPEPDCTSRLNC